MPWSTPFEEPIRLRGGGSLTTLQHAADYIIKLPSDVQHQERWQIAVENLINAAEIGGGWLMFARIGMMRALNGNQQGSLLQRRAHRGEFGAEGATDPVGGSNDHDADTGRDDAIFDRSRAGLIRQES